MRVLAAIATLFTRDKLKDVITSLENQTIKPDRIVLITPDGELPDDWKSFLSQHEEVEVHYLESYARQEVLNKEKDSRLASRNHALAEARGSMENEDIIIFFDDDCPVDNDWIEVAINNLKSEESGGFTGQTINYRDQGNLRKFEMIGLSVIKYLFGTDKIGQITDCGFVASNFDNQSKSEVMHLPGNSMAYKIAAVKNIDFDENYKGNCYREETDFSVRVGKSWKLIYDPGTTAHHFIGVTRRDKFSMYYKNYNHIYFWKKNFRFTLCFFLREALETIFLIGASIVSFKTDYLYGVKGKIDSYRRFLFPGNG